jgi:hypothetical protein
LTIEIVLSCGTKCEKVQYQATKEAAGNALGRHIPWLNSTSIETFQSHINISSSFSSNSHFHFTKTNQEEIKSESILLPLHTQKHLPLAG